MNIEFKPSNYKNCILSKHNETEKSLEETIKNRNDISECPTASLNDFHANYKKTTGILWIGKKITLILEIPKNILKLLKIAIKSKIKSNEKTLLNKEDYKKISQIRMQLGKDKVIASLFMIISNKKGSYKKEKAQFESECLKISVDQKMREKLGDCKTEKEAINIKKAKAKAKTVDQKINLAKKYIEKGKNNNTIENLKIALEILSDDNLEYEIPEYYSYKLTENLKEIENGKLNDYRYEIVELLIDKKEYEEALKATDKLTTKKFHSENKNKILIKIAEKLVEEEKYIKAFEAIKKIDTTYSETKEKIKKITKKIKENILKEKEINTSNLSTWMSSINILLKMCEFEIPIEEHSLKVITENFAYEQVENLMNETIRVGFIGFIDGDIEDSVRAAFLEKSLRNDDDATTDKILKSIDPINSDNVIKNICKEKITVGNYEGALKDLLKMSDRYFPYIRGVTNLIDQIVEGFLNTGQFAKADNAIKEIEKKGIRLTYLNEKLFEASNGQYGEKYTTKSSGSNGYRNFFEDFFEDYEDFFNFSGGSRTGEGPRAKRETKFSEEDKKKFFELIEISSDSSHEQVKRAYLKAVRKHHPDRGGDNQVMQEINDLYDKYKEAHDIV